MSDVRLADLQPGDTISFELCTGERVSGTIQHIFPSEAFPGSYGARVALDLTEEARASLFGPVCREQSGFWTHLFEYDRNYSTLELLDQVSAD